MTSALPCHLSSVGSFENGDKHREEHKREKHSGKALSSHRDTQQLNSVLDEVGHCTQAKYLVLSLRGWEG